MDFGLDKQQRQFLEGLRAYLDLFDLDEVVADFERDFKLITGPSREFLRQLGRDGWLGVGWPKEYGGQGRSAVEQWLFLEEMAYLRHLRFVEGPARGRWSVWGSGPTRSSRRPASARRTLPSCAAPVPSDDSAALGHHGRPL